jgi:hypothetical protein
VPLKVLVAQAGNDVARLQQLLDFETSVAKGSLATGYKVTLSTQPARVGQQLFPLNGFEYLAATQSVRQPLEIDGVLVERTFTIDTLETNVSFDLTTGFAPAAAKWYERESPTLTRYAKVLS